MVSGCTHCEGKKEMKGSNYNEINVDRKSGEFINRKHFVQKNSITNWEQCNPFCSPEKSNIHNPMRYEAWYHKKHLFFMPNNHLWKICFRTIHRCSIHGSAIYHKQFATGAIHRRAVYCGLVYHRGNSPQTIKRRETHLQKFTAEQGHYKLFINHHPPKMGSKVIYRWEILPQKNVAFLFTMNCLRWTCDAMNTPTFLW
jgi:hypothetical protein